MSILALILLFGVHIGVSQNRAGNMSALGKLTNIEKTQHEVIARYKLGRAVVQVFKPGIFHLTIENNTKALKSFAVVESPEELARYKTEVGREQVKVDLPDGIIEFLPETLGLRFLSANGKDLLDLSRFEFLDTGLVANFNIHNARDFFGLGEKTLPYNKYGSRYVMWNTDHPAYGVKFDPLYETVPFLLKADTGGAYGIFFDNPSLTRFDVGATESNTLTYTARAGAFQLYIITGKNAADVVKKFADLTGKMHMPPLWSLGYQQSRWSYYPESRVLTLARNFRAKKIPCDVIYLDINYMNGYRCFTWSPKDFPTPVKMLDTLRSLGFKVVTIIDPGIKDEKGYKVYDSGMKKDVFVKLPDGKDFVGRVWPGDCVFPDFFSEKARAWWGEQYKPLIEDGVNGFWNDMNEPSVFNTPNKTFPPDVLQDVDGDTVEHYEVHNAYGMQMARATRDGLEKLEPGKRPFVLTRSNYAGGQRYAAMWTGDNFASFAHLKLALAMFLNIGVSGQPFVGSDVGGFVGNPSPELYTRWLELGVFTPFFRTHSTNDSKPREPWVFGGEYTKINRETIDRRYELMPEIYTAFRIANETGLPIVRPLYLEFPNDPEAYKIYNEFIFGSKLLVAPVLDSGAVSRKVYLPAGEWTSIHGGAPLSAGWHDVNAPLGVTPVFVREGTILFTQSLIQNTSEQSDTLYLRAYGDKSASGGAYFDDGETYAFRNGDYLNMKASLERTERGVDMEIAEEGKFVPRYKEISVLLQVKQPVKSAVAKTIDGRTLNAVVTKLSGDIVQVTFPFEVAIKTIHLE